jgi:hypothetical protein
MGISVIGSRDKCRGRKKFDPGYIPGKWKVAAQSRSGARPRQARCRARSRLGGLPARSCRLNSNPWAVLAHHQADGHFRRDLH